METVVVEHHNAVRRIILNRPSRRNAQNFLMWRELDEVGARISNDPNVRCVVITGLENFSSGIDLAEVAPPDGALISIGHLARTDMAAATKKLADIQSQFLWITESHLPVVAAVRGVALGAGLELALACDVRIVASDARLSLPEVSIGVVPDLGGCHHLLAGVGYERAFDLIMNSREITGIDAVALGIALKHDIDSKIDPLALSYAHAIADLAPTAVRYTKRALKSRTSAESLIEAAKGMAQGLVALAGAGDPPAAD